MIRTVFTGSIFKRALLILLAFQLTACAELQKIAETVGSEMLTNDQVASGLKDALNIGIGKGADILSQKDGYFKSAYKILLPNEAMQVMNKLKVIPGMEQVENIMLEKLNRAAEDAATKAKPIFVDAIRQMNFSDVMNILMGSNNAATSYLQRTTTTNLYNAFNPVIVSSLNKFNAIQYWSDLVSKYNSLPFVTKMNPRLDDYVTNQALNGLFSMVEKEEKNIRTNISSRTTDLLKKVFAKQDSNRSQY